MTLSDDPHREASVVRGGSTVEEADAAILALHGRGAAAEGMVELASEFDTTDVAILAPQARDRTWYPQSFLAPIENNEPWLSSALALVERVLADLEADGIAVDRTLLLGFSQGACLATEYVARNARRYGGLAALSGGVIGPEGTPREYNGSLEGTPVFIGCGDRDPHIPVDRVEETRDILTSLGGDVNCRIYSGMGHGVNEDEINHVHDLIGNIGS